LSFDRGAPAFWFVEIFLDGETLRHSNAGEAITFDGQTYLPLGDKLTPPRDIDRAANLKAQKFTLRYDSSLQTVDTDVVGKILDSNWKRRPIRVRYAIGDVGASGYDFSDPFIIADETGRVKDLEDTIEAGDAPLIEMEVESGALVFLERRNQTRTPANQRAAFPDDAFFDLAKRLDGVVLPWRTKRARNGSAQITYEIDEPAPREMLIGRGITRGSFVFGCTVGPHRGWWIQVFALADHECEALEQCFINGVDVLAGQAPLEHGVKRNLNFGGEPRLSLTWYDGRHDQTANAELITLTAAQPLKWTSAHRGRGISYCIVEHRWDSDLPESYTHEFVLKGAKVYREQFDTTAGGSGSHRLNDPDSWTWTANPEEALRHYLRGRVVSPSSSYKWFGVDAPTSFIDPYAAYKYRADHCDEGVALKLGGTQPRYEANGWISAADSHAKNIQKLADCMVADPVDEGGRVSIRLSEPQTPVVELLDTDLMSDEETVAGVNARAEDVINRVEGRYRDPSNKYSQTDYPAVASEAFQEIDGAEIEGTFNQDLENSEERAQRKATLYLNKMRRTLELEEHFGPKAKDVRPGDWVTRKSALRGFPSGKTFIADEVRRFTDGTVRLLLLEVDPGEIAWNEADAQLTSIGAGPSTYDPPEILIPSVAVLAVSVTGGGATYPGVRFTVTDYDDFVGDEIECEFGIWNGVSGGGMGIAGPSAILKIPGSLETFDAAANFLPGTTYAFRFRERAGERQGAWSAFQTETMTGDYIVGASAIADSIVGQGPGATAAAADVLNGYTPIGVNALIDHDFRFGATFWRTLASAGTVSAATNETLGIRRRTLTGTGVTIGQTIQLDTFPDRTRFACRAGDVIEASAFVSASNVSAARIQIAFHNAADAVVGTSILASATPGTGTASLADFVRIFSIGTAPAGTAYARLIVTGVSSTTSPVLHVARPMLARCNSLQTAPSPWNPGFDATPGADPTAANQAASIAGQGSGATANNLAGLNATDNANLTTSLSTSRRLIVSDFNADGRHWTTAFGGTPEAMSDPNAEGYADVANVGRVIRFNAFSRFLQPKGVFTPVPGRRYALIARVRTETAPSGGVITYSPSLNGLTTAYAHGDPLPVLGTIPGIASSVSPAAGTWTLVARTFQLAASPNSFNAFWRPRLDITATGTGGRAEVVSCIILDVTDVPLGRLITGLLRDDATTPITEAAVITLLGTASAITGQGPGATAPAADVLNGHVPNGVNQLIDHEFRFADTFWRRTSQSGSTTGATNETLGIRRRTVTGSGVTVGHFIQLDSFPDRTRFACRAGDVIEASAFVSGSNLSAASVFLTFYDAANLLIGFSAVNNFTPGTATASLNDFVRGFVIATAPANTAMAFINVRGTASSSAPVMHVARPMLARCNSLQTAPTAWNPGFNATPGADPTAANQAASIAGQGPGATAAAAAVLNENIATRGLFSARPASGVFTGQLYYATDTGQQFEWTGAAWALRADITAQAQLTISATATTVIVNCDSAGVPAAGQLPRTVGIVLKLGNTVVSADAAWSIVSAGAATATVDDTATSAAGNLTVTALPSNADVIVSATYGGVTLRITVSFQRLLAPPPVSGSGGGTSASDTSIVDPASTSFTVVSDTLTITTGSGGQARLVANVDYNHFGPVGQRIIGRWQRNISGTWTDVGTEISGTDSYTQLDAESGSILDFPGTLSIDQTITGLGASTSQSFRLRTRRSGGTSWGVYGSATATGS
jgi:hypothetical protein